MIINLLKTRSFQICIKLLRWLGCILFVNFSAELESLLSKYREFNRNVKDFILLLEMFVFDTYLCYMAMRSYNAFRLWMEIFLLCSIMIYIDTFVVDKNINKQSTEVFFNTWNSKQKS